MSYSSDVLALSPDAYWRLGEASGTTMVDSSGNGRDGTYAGSSFTFGVTGIPGAGSDKAITWPGLNGNNGSIATPTWANRTASMGVGCWFKTTATGNGYMVQRWGTTSTDQIFGLDQQSSNVFRGYYRVNGVNRILSATVTGKRDGNWHFLFVNYDGSNVRLYLDGVEVGTAIAATGNINTSSETIRVAQRSSTSSDPYNGTLDEVYIGPALNATQIANLYTSGSTAATLGGTAGVVAESDAAQPVGRRKSKTAGVVAESDAAQPIARVKRYAVGTVTESDASVHITRPGTFLPATETDTAQPLGRVKRYTIGTATEADSLQPFAKSKRRSIGTSTETDAAQLLKRTRPYVIGAVLETDAAQQITQSGVISRIIGTVVETDTARPVGVVQYGGDIPEDPPIEPEPNTLNVRPLRVMASSLPAPDFVDGRPA